MASSLRGFWRYLEGIGPSVMRIMSYRIWPQLESWTTTLAGFAKPMLKLVDNGDRDVKTVNTPSSLLNLPPELRNRIYEFALVEPKEIQVHQQNIVKPPALLACCRQIRFEALKIFFTSNTFKIYAVDCDGHLFISWRRHFSSYMKDAQGKHIALGLCIMGRPVWQNILQWQKAHFEERLGMTLALDSVYSSSIHQVYHSTTRITKRAQRAGRSWDEVKQDLEDLHSAIAACESTWR